MGTAVSTGLSASLKERIAAKRKDIKAKSGLRADVIRVPPGKNKFRILPAHPSLGADAEFWADFGQHYIKDLEGKTKAVYVCTDKTFGRPCGVCHALEVAGRGVTDDQELTAVNESQCKRAEILVNVLHLNSSDKANVPQVLQLTPSTFEKILGLMDEYDDITSLTDGTDLIITREGTGLNTEYTVQPARTSAKVDAMVMDSVVNLREFVQQESEEGARKAIAQINAIVGVVDDYAPAPRVAAAPAAARIASKAAVIDDMEVAEPKAAGKAPAPAATAISDDELDQLMEFEEVLEATGTDGAAVSKSVPAASDAPSVDDLDALLGELDSM